MEIHINKIQSEVSNHALVSFESEYGICEGLWEGALPEINRSYDVEINIVDELLWNFNAFATNEQKCVLEKAEDTLKIVVEMESLQEGDCCILKIGNMIIMAEIRNLPSLEKGSFIELRPKEIKLFDSDL